MKKAVITLSIVLSGLMILDSMNAPHAVMMFLLAGVIPGTTIVLSPGDMLSVFALLIGFVLARITNTLVLQIRSNGRLLSQNA